MRRRTWTIGQRFPYRGSPLSSGNAEDLFEDADRLRELTAPTLLLALDEASPAIEALRRALPLLSAAKLRLLKGAQLSSEIAFAREASDWFSEHLKNVRSKLVA